MSVSIIIPCYNTDSMILDRCIESVLNQTIEDYEVIIVDDGSNRDCFDKLESFKTRSDKIKVFHIANHGVSYARNYGINQANKDYVTFVDADDQLEPYFLGDAMHILQETNCDMLVGGLCFTDKKPDRTIRDTDYYYVKPEDFICNSISGKSVIRMSENSYIGRGPVCRLVRLPIARETKFKTELQIGEDIVWNLQVLKKIKSLVVCKSVWYIYYNYGSSATHIFNPNVIEITEKELNCIRNEISIHNERQYKEYADHIFEELNRIDKTYFALKKDMNKSEYKQLTHYLYTSKPWTDVKNFKYFFKTMTVFKKQIIFYCLHLLFFNWQAKRTITGGK